MNQHGVVAKSGVKGYLLIETILALAIIGFSLMGLTLLFTTGLGSSLHASLYTQALYLAEGELEETLLKPASDWVSDTTYSKDIGKSEYQVRLKTQPSDISKTLYVFQIEVQWKESDGFHRVQLMTEGRGQP